MTTENGMDLGIAGRKAIVCASSRGLGYGCAHGAGPRRLEVVINGRDEKRLTAAADEITKATGAKVIAVACRCCDARWTKSPARSACPETRHPGEQQCRSADARFPRIVARADPRWRDCQHGGCDRADPEGHRSDDRKKLRPDRQHHLGHGEGTTRRPRSVVRRACRPDRLHGRGRAFRCRLQCQRSTSLPGAFDTDRLKSNIEGNAKRQNITFEQSRQNRINSVPAKRFGTADEFGATCAFLCSTHAGYITGQNILIDGGVYPAAF